MSRFLQGKRNLLFRTTVPGTSAQPDHRTVRIERHFREVVPHDWPVGRAFQGRTAFSWRDLGDLTWREWTVRSYRNQPSIEILQNGVSIDVPPPALAVAWEHDCSTLDGWTVSGLGAPVAENDVIKTGVYHGEWQLAGPILTKMFDAPIQGDFEIEVKIRVSDIAPETNRNGEIRLSIFGDQGAEFRLGQNWDPLLYAGSATSWYYQSAAPLTAAVVAGLFDGTMHIAQKGTDLIFKLNDVEFGRVPNTTWPTGATGFALMLGSYAVSSPAPTTLEIDHVALKV